MTRHSVAVAIGALLASYALPIRGAVVQHPTFRSRTDAVSINASVKRGSTPITDLTAPDFRLSDNGVEQKVEALSLERVPIDLTLVLTGYLRGGDNKGAYFRALTSASIVRQSLRPQDRLRVVWVHAEVRGTLVDNEDSLLAHEVKLEHYGGVSVADGLFYALAWPVDADRRHLVVAFTDGFDTFSTLDLDAVPRLAAHSEAVLHIVFFARPGEGVTAAGGIGGLETSSGGAEWRASQQLLSDTARRTGGMTHRAGEASRDLAAIVADFRTSYVLQYTPQGVKPGGWHDVRVRVTRPGRFDVRARQGYEIGRE
jgi:VWFA-related protein